MTSDQRREAETVWIRTSFQSLFGFATIMSFRKVGRLGLPYALRVQKDRGEFHVTLNQLLTAPDCEGIIRDPEKFVASGLPERIPQMLMAKTEKDFVVSLDSASIIFAHSILDSVAMEYCRLSGLIAPEDWFQKVMNKKVELREAVQSEKIALIQKTLQVYFSQLEKESLLKKLDCLHSVCMPKKPEIQISNYKYERNRIEVYDDLRHRIVHGSERIEPLKDGDKEIDYLMRTCFPYLWVMVGSSYGLRFDERVFDAAMKVMQT